MSVIYLNGEFVENSTLLISHKDCGFTTGIGIFDSMLGQDGKLIHGQEHYERIVYDTKTVIGLELFPLLNPPPFEGRRKESGEATFRWVDFEKIVQILLQKNNLLKGYARIRTTVTGGEADTPLAIAKNLTTLIDVAPCSAPPKTPVICAIITDFPRIAGCILENCKRLDYSRSYAARRKAKSFGAQEAILTNTDGNISCGATSNIFIEENGVLITPPLSDGVLAGVTRRKIIEQQKVREKSISPERLQAADKIYLTNSFVGLREVVLTG